MILILIFNIKGSMGSGKTALIAHTFGAFIESER